MKKRGDSCLRRITILLAVALGTYVLLSALRRGERYTFETTAYCEVGDGLTVSGFAVRDETVLTANAPFTVREAHEGEWVGGGQCVVTGYSSEKERQRREELMSLQAERKQLAAPADAALEEEIAERILSLRTKNVDAARTALKLCVLRSYAASEEALRSRRLAALDARIGELQTHAEETVTADTAGYFSAHVDGFEGVLTPAALETMTLSELRMLCAETVPKNAVGRLISGQKWYFVTELPVGRTAHLEVGDRLRVDYFGVARRQTEMKLERLGTEENGACLAVLSCERGLQNMTALRRQTAEIVFDVCGGLRVPKTAIYCLDGETGVYVLEGARAAWKPITVLCECGESFLAEWDSTDTDRLQPGDELILTSDELYDRKVIRK